MTDEWDEWRRKQKLSEQATREQIPAQPVVPVGPITIEQKVAALNDEIAKIQKQIHYIFGLLNVVEP